MLFGLNELILDLTYAAQSYAQIDLESLYILYCINEATMRPFMLDDAVQRDVLVATSPPEEIRGSISRRSIADKTGLARETVRRKTSDLISRGLVLIDKDDRLRSAPKLDDPAQQRMIETAHAAVLRYLACLRRLGVDEALLSPREP
jgi:hypothetical protein